MVEKNYKNLPKGGVIVDAGNAEMINISDWRTCRPIHIPEKCINCMKCWSVCPDNAIRVKDGKFISFDYSKCKGCMLCYEHCPVKAIDKKIESGALNEEN